MTSSAGTPTGNIIGMFWRCITPSDFFNIERHRDAGPKGGGGQLYIDIPLSRTRARGLYFNDFGVFFSGHPLDDDYSKWTDLPIQAFTASDPVIQSPLVLTPRGGTNFRYRISNQNRQATESWRHPAWSAERGFPQAPDDISSRDDSRMPDLSFLKVYIARTETGGFVAGYTNSASMPNSWPHNSGLQILFQRNSTRRADGIIAIEASLGFNVDHLRDPIASSKASATDGVSVVSSGSIVRRSIAVHAPIGSIEAGEQGSPIPRSDLTEAISIDAPQASAAEDWVEHQLSEIYGEERVWRIGHTELERMILKDGELPGADIILLNSDLNQPHTFVEVKSAKDSFPSIIRLTASEWRRAKDCADRGLPYEIWIVTFAEPSITAMKIPFDQMVTDLTIEDLVTLGLQIKKDDAVQVLPASQ